MLNRRRLLPAAAAAMACLIVASGASADPINTFTAAVAPTHVKPASSVSYTVVLTNDPSSPEGADRAKIGIPPGFVVNDGNLQATTSALGACQASSWVADGELIADAKINLKRPGVSPSDELCPGAALTVVFAATAGGAEGSAVWASELLRGAIPFALAGAQPTVQVDGTPPALSITVAPQSLSNQDSPSFGFTAGEPATFECSLDAAAFAACASPRIYTNLADGSHTFVVKAADSSGNTAQASHAWTIDTAAPTAVITDKPSDPSNDNSPSFAFGADGPAQFQCKLDAGAFASCASPKSYSGLGEGLHTFAVRAADAAGNVGPEASHGWTVDTVAPTTTITQKPANPSNDSSPSFVFTAGEPGQFQCKLDAAAFAPCASPQTYDGLAAGPHTISVRATDAAGNIGTGATYGWMIDTTAPTTEITVKPLDPSNDGSPTFSFTASEGSSSFACKLDDGAFEPCVTPKTYSAVAAGSHTFSVRATDAAGNTGTADAYAWTIDTAAPTTTITQKPGNPSNDSSPSFAFAASEAGTQFACRLDGGSFAPCVSIKTYPGLGDGSHTFTVRATDAAGNLGVETSFTWVVDTIAPTATITVKPSNPSNATSPSFSFTASQVGSSFVCKLDGSAFAPCTSPAGYSGLADGPHTFVVKATDPAGNPSVEATYTWTIDSVAPTAAITGKPSDPSNNTSPSFSFTANESGSTFRCRLDGGAFASCASPKQQLNLPAGTHTFTVQATDNAGNTSPQANYSWTIDTAAPTAEITQKPTALSNNHSASFSFTASQSGSTFACRLDGAAFAACVSPKNYSVADGLHTFTVKATDPAGNTSAETSFTWTVDTTPPAVGFSTRPPDPSNDVTPSFSFSASEPSSFACKLDAGAFASCVSPKDLGTLAPGQHTFSVTATDPAGNAGAQVSHTWTIDTIAPTTTITLKPTDLSNSNGPSFAFTASEVGSSFSCRLDGAAFAACSTPKIYSALGDGSHTFVVRATDLAGNTGASSTHTWTIDATTPTVTISQKPGDPTNDTSPSFAFGANETVTFQCKLDAAAAAACSGTMSYPIVGQGQHTFIVTATDAAGNTRQASHSWRIDTTAPTATITQKPGNPSNTSSPTFAYTSNEGGVVYACRLELGGFEPCPSPKTYANLTDGQHAFAVRATDAAGNTGVAATYTWTIDTVKPTTSITAKPGNPSNNPSPSFSFTSSEDASFVCLLDGSATPCTSPAGYSGLSDGPHAFSVRATDAAGNTGVETAYDWTIETRSPTAGLVSGPPGLSNSSAASFAFAADEPSAFDCKLDDRGFEPCNSPVTYHGLADGAHAFLVRARDGVGNLSAQVAHSWAIDTTAPETTVVSAPKSGTATSATFAFSASEGGTFECRLDGAPFVLCESPKRYTGLSKATHRFEVRAIDAAGNADLTPSLHGWRIEVAVVRLASSALLTPKAGAKVKRPPLLVWRRATRARYYNVQLYRGRRKVLTAWPTRTRLQLQTKWTNLGRKERLLPGSYRWYVWPGYGAPSARRYGQLLGQSTFVVARRSGR